MYKHKQEHKSVGKTSFPTIWSPCINIQKEAEPLNWNNFEASRRAVLQKVDGSQFHNVSHVVPWSLAPAAGASEVLAMRRNIEAWFSKQPESHASKQLPLGAKLT